MVALADLIDLRGTLRRQRRRNAQVREHDRQVVQLIEISSVGIRACGTNGLVLGEAISIEIPALGSLNAFITWTKGREFGAEFCGACDLRLLFLRKSSVGCNSWYERRARLK